MRQPTHPHDRQGSFSRPGTHAWRHPAHHSCTNICMRRPCPRRPAGEAYARALPPPPPRSPPLSRGISVVLPIPHTQVSPRIGYLAHRGVPQRGLPPPPVRPPCVCRPARPMGAVAGRPPSILCTVTTSAPGAHLTAILRSAPQYGLTNCSHARACGRVPQCDHRDRSSTAWCGGISAGGAAAASCLPPRAPPAPSYA